MSAWFSTRAALFSGDQVTEARRVGEAGADSVSPATVKFRGAQDLSLVAHEWNGDIASASAHPSALMLHGGGQTRHSWRNTGQRLANEGFHVVALDTRGHGDSEWSPHGLYAVEELCHDTVAVVEQINRPLAIIGASIGGLTAIMAAAAAGPENVTKLGLVDMVPRYEGRGSDRVQEFMLSHLDGFATLQEAADAVSAYLPHRTKPRRPDGLRRNLRQRDGRWYWHWDPAFVAGAAHDTRTIDTLEDAVIGLRIPILLIRGQLSDVVSSESVADFLHKVPHAEFVELDRAGHTAAGDDNDAFSDAVVRFVRN
jgi:pimeloyl-ACP methyl ester carboxylesterase